MKATSVWLLHGANIQPLFYKGHLCLTKPSAARCATGVMNAVLHLIFCQTEDRGNRNILAAFVFFVKPNPNSFLAIGNHLVWMKASLNN